MSRPSVYLDECVHYDLVAALRKRGFLVTAARQQGTTGLADADQLALATHRGEVIVTYNARHFERLHLACRQEGREHGGITLLPQRGSLDVRELRLAMLLDWIALTVADPRSRLFRWGQLQRLLEQGLRVPGYTEDDVRLVLRR